MKLKQAIRDVGGRTFSSAHIFARPDEAITILEKTGYETPLSLEDNAFLRIQEGPQAYISKRGNWVGEEVLHLPGEESRLSKARIYVANVKRITGERRSTDAWSHVTREQRDQALENSVSLEGNSKIPTSRFGEDKRTIFMFGGIARLYGDWLREVKGVTEMPLFVKRIRDGLYVSPLWFGDPSKFNESELIGVGAGFCSANLMRGIREGEGSTFHQSVYGPEWKRKVLDIERLQKKLEEAANEGDYEKATRLRDKLNNLLKPKVN